MHEQKNEARILFIVRSISCKTKKTTTTKISPWKCWKVILIYIYRQSVKCMKCQHYGWMNKWRHIEKSSTNITQTGLFSPVVFTCWTHIWHYMAYLQQQEHLCVAESIWDLDGTITHLSVNGTLMDWKESKVLHTDSSLQNVLSGEVSLNLCVWTKAVETADKKKYKCKKWEIKVMFVFQREKWWNSPLH